MYQLPLLFVFFFAIQLWEKQKTHQSKADEKLLQNNYSKRETERLKILTKAFQKDPNYIFLQDLITRFDSFERANNKNGMIKIARQISSIYLSLEEEEYYREWKEKEKELAED